MKRFVEISIVSLVILALAFGSVAVAGRAADHLDAPLAKLDGRLDINDVYVFHPGAPDSQKLGRTVLAMTVNPAAGVISGRRFHPNADYELSIDRDGDAEADAVINTRFKEADKGKQPYEVTYKEGDGKPRVIAKGWTESEVKGAPGVRAFAGLRDDPFFFDLNSFNDGATFCESGDSDFFLGLNVSAIVIEVPTRLLGEGAVGVWGVTRDPVMGTVDRMGRPAILTVFIPPNPFELSPPEPMLEDAFNFVKPSVDQVLFRQEIVDSLTLLFSLNDASDDPSDDAAQIEGLADFLLPDILTVDLSQPTGFPNGRNLADDVIDTELGLITEGLITTDCIDNDSQFLNNFPYLGRPN
jgi:hypothetical protein